MCRLRRFNKSRNSHPNIGCTEDAAQINRTGTALWNDSPRQFATVSLRCNLEPAAAPSPAAIGAAPSAIHPLQPGYPESAPITAAARARRRRQIHGGWHIVCHARQLSINAVRLECRRLLQSVARAPARREQAFDRQTERKPCVGDRRPGSESDDDECPAASATAPQHCPRPIGRVAIMAARHRTAVHRLTRAQHRPQACSPGESATTTRTARPSTDSPSRTSIVTVGAEREPQPV